MDTSSTNGMLKSLAIGIDAGFATLNDNENFSIEKS